MEIRRAMAQLTPEEAAQSHADLVRIPCIVFFAVTPIFLAIRIWNRLTRKSGLGMDDVTILMSFVCTLVVQICMMMSCKYGFGRHIASLTKENKLLALEYFYVAQIFYKLTINLTKTSILLLYLRIFVQKWFRVCCYILLSIVIAYTIASASMAIWQCSPIRGAWDKSIHAQCISLTKNWYANAGYSIATDLLILGLPMQPIWTSKLPINQKRALMIVFALGSFGTVSSIMRATTIDFSTTSPDSTFDINSTLWTMIEENIAIICACLPMCRIVLSMIFPKLFGGTTTNASNGASDGMGSDSHNAKLGYQRTTSPRSSWKPYSGPGQKEAMNRHVTSHPNDDTSEEFILTSITSVNRQVSGEEYDGTIRKTTKYEVSYENDVDSKR